MPTHGFNNPNDADFGPTAGRVTTLTLDGDDRVLIERGINETRRGGEIAKADAEGVVGDSATFGMRYWASGAWTLRPIQQDITTIYEETAGQSAILQLSDFTGYQLNNSSGTAVNALTTRQNFTQSNFTNPGYTGAIAASADPFIRPNWPAGGDHDPASVAANAALVATVPQVTLDNLTTAMDRVGVTPATFPQDEAFFLRFSAPGSYHNYPRYMWTFYFGQYSVTFTGDGKALLHEYCRATAGGTRRWKFRRSFRYANSKQVLGTSHTLIVFPHTDANNRKVIAFANADLDAASRANTLQHADVGFVAPKEVVYRAGGATRGGDVDEAGAGHVTTSGPVAWDIRRELMVEVQISKIAWATSGKLVDFAHTVGTAVANTNPVTVTMAKVVPGGTTLTAEVHDARTGVTFVPGTDSQPYPVFFFGGDGTKTPILYGYHMTQAEVVQTVSPGSFAPGIERASIADFSGDPAEVSASCEAYDLLGTHTRLTKRGRLRANIALTDPAAVTEGRPDGRVSLFDGYVVRPRSVQAGPDTTPGFGPPGSRARRTYPAPRWRRFILPMMGMWMRLAERVTPSFGVFATDPAATPDPVYGLQPWKVTDAIRFLLLSCGFDSTQVDIPDLSYRMWPGHAGSITDGVIEPGATLADAITRMCRNYLGCYLWWNPNSGSAGKWQLLFGAQPNEDGTFTPVYNFVTTPPAGALAAVHIPGNYGPQTAPVNGSPEYLTVPPDFNTVIVSTGAPLTGADTDLKTVAYAYNYASWKVPGSTVDPNPEDADYIGYALPIEIIDPSLTGRDDAETWAAVRWTCRRAYDFYCHAQRIVTFEAPLALILDSGLGVYRPLRYQDPVSLDGDASYLIKSVAIDYAKSHLMMCRYELIAPYPGQFFWGTDGLHFKRKAQALHAQKATGHKTRSNHWGLQAPGPAHEQSRLSLPLNNTYQVPLQDNTGAFTGGWAAYDAATKGL